MKSIESYQNQWIRRLVRLSNSSAFRYEQRQYVVEGSIIMDGSPLNLLDFLFVPETIKSDPKLQSFLAAVDPSKICYVAPSLTKKISTLVHSQELIGIFNMPPRIPLDTVQSDCIVLDRVQDPGNVGTIIRTAAAAGIPHVLLSSGCADVYMPKVIRAAMGSHFQVKLHTHVDLMQWAKHYSHPIWLTGLFAEAVNLYQLDLCKAEAAAWILGNEGAGISPELLSVITKNKGVKVKIPIVTKIESLNVAVAASVCIFEQLRQRTVRKRPGKSPK
ncbi:MAG: RNA methyltransferase [Neisseriaceae bacterium]